MLPQHHSDLLDFVGDAIFVQVDRAVIIVVHDQLDETEANRAPHILLEAH